jgi:hypothetical protein
MPINRSESQPPPFHFLAKPVCILLGCIANKSIATASLLICFHLTANALVKVQERFITSFFKRHWSLPSSLPYFILRNWVQAVHH